MSHYNESCLINSLELRISVMASGAADLVVRINQKLDQVNDLGAIFSSELVSEGLRPIRSDHGNLNDEDLSRASKDLIALGKNTDPNQIDLWLRYTRLFYGVVGLNNADAVLDALDPTVVEYLDSDGRRVYSESLDVVNDALYDARANLKNAQGQ